jgi:K+-sensing histidine kinase KdpD
VNRAVEFAQSEGVMLESAPADVGWILGVEDLLIKALQALLETAVKFSRAGETVRLACQPAPDCIQVVIESRGLTIPSPALSKFFDVFSIGEAVTPGGDIGLRPAVAHKILALFGGSVSVENRDSSGIRLTLSLRRAA